MFVCLKSIRPCCDGRGNLQQWWHFLVHWHPTFRGCHSVRTSYNQSHLGTRSEDMCLHKHKLMFTVNMSPQPWSGGRADKMAQLLTPPRQFGDQHELGRAHLEKTSVNWIFMTLNSICDHFIVFQNTLSLVLFWEVRWLGCHCWV